MNASEIADLLRPACKHEVRVDLTATPDAILVHVDDWLHSARILFENPSCYFDLLSCVTGIDNGPEAKTMEVAYQLYSIPFNRSLMIKVSLPREHPEIESVVEIWKSADWLERETFDMFGIRFNNHPDLRRILMPADWEGYPLRKDYQHQEKYRAIQVKY